MKRKLLKERLQKLAGVKKLITEQNISYDVPIGYDDPIDMNWDVILAGENFNYSGTTPLGTNIDFWGLQSDPFSGGCENNYFSNDPAVTEWNGIGPCPDLGYDSYNYGPQSTLGLVPTVVAYQTPNTGIDNPDTESAYTGINCDGKIFTNIISQGTSGGPNSSFNTLVNYIFENDIPISTPFADLVYQIPNGNMFNCSSNVGSFWEVNSGRCVNPANGNAYHVLFGKLITGINPMGNNFQVVVNSIEDMIDVLKNPQYGGDPNVAFEDYISSYEDLMQALSSFDMTCPAEGCGATCMCQCNQEDGCITCETINDWNEENDGCMDPTALNYDPEALVDTQTNFWGPTNPTGQCEYAEDVFYSCENLSSTLQTQMPPQEMFGPISMGSGTGLWTYATYWPAVGGTEAGEGPPITEVETFCQACALWEADPYISIGEGGVRIFGDWIYGDGSTNLYNFFSTPMPIANPSEISIYQNNEYVWGELCDCCDESYFEDIIYGCTDSEYVQYNPDAYIDDGSCETLWEDSGCPYEVQIGINSDGSPIFTQEEGVNIIGSFGEYLDDILLNYPDFVGMNNISNDTAAEDYCLWCYNIENTTMGTDGFMSVNYGTDIEPNPSSFCSCCDLLNEPINPVEMSCDDFDQFGESFCDGCATGTIYDNDWEYMEGVMMSDYCECCPEIIDPVEISCDDFEQYSESFCNSCATGDIYSSPEGIMTSDYCECCPEIPVEEFSCTEFEQTIETDGDLQDEGIDDTESFCDRCPNVSVLEEYCECCPDDEIENETNCDTFNSYPENVQQDMCTSYFDMVNGGQQFDPNLAQYTQNGTCCDSDPNIEVEDRGYNCRKNLGGDSTAQKCVPCGPTGDCEFETEQACIDSGCEIGCDDMSPADNSWLCTACDQGTTPENFQHLCGCCKSDKKNPDNIEDSDIETLQNRAGITNTKK